MANGWVSKSIEQQQAEAAAPSITAAHTELTAEARRAEADRKRRIQAHELQRERVLSERTSSPHRRTALSNALADIEEKLAELGWTIHL